MRWFLLMMALALLAGCSGSADKKKDDPAAPADSVSVEDPNPPGDST
jgi:outer membrane biogenesis lipoprotein LolB